MAGESSHWTVRLEAARDAARRTRLAFLVVTVISVAISISEFNSSISWNENFVASSGDQHLAADTVRSVAEKAFIEAAIKANRVTVSLLGVDFGMSDAAVLGSVGLWILVLWLFFSARRENHLVGKLLGDASRYDDAATRAMVFHGTASQMVFLSITDSDEPIEKLEVAEPPEAPSFTLRPIVAVLFFIPVLTIAFIFVMDIISLWFFQSPIRPADGSLWEQLLQHRRELIRIVVWEAFPLIFGAATLYSCHKIYRFQKATASVLREFHRRFMASLSPDKGPVIE